MEHSLFDFPGGKENWGMVSPVSANAQFDDPCSSGRNVVLRKRCIEILKDLEMQAKFLDPEKLEVQLDGAKRVYASAATLHRGYFCPSPVRDIVVDNELRGQLLPDMAEDGFVYFVDDSGKLLGCEEYLQGKCVQREYLQRNGEVICGFSYLPSKELWSMSRERYAGEKLLEYVLVICISGSVQCFVEDYFYDEQGLESSEQCFYEADTGIVRQWRYLFEREEGALRAYYVTRIGCPFPVDEEGNCIAHEITVARKA